MNKKRTTMILPLETVDYLNAWMMSPEHISYPYPNEQEKAEIMAETGIELKQLMNWFANKRRRYWKPMMKAKKMPPPPPLHYNVFMMPSPPPLHYNMFMIPPPPLQYPSSYNQQPIAMVMDGVSNTTQQLVAAPPAKKMSVLPAMPVAAVAKSTPTSIASASVPSLKPASSLLLRSV